MRGHNQQTRVKQLVDYSMQLDLHNDDKSDNNCNEKKNQYVIL